MTAINPPIVREQARDRFFALLRARYWTEEERESMEVATDGLENASDVVEELATVPLILYRKIRDDLLEKREFASRAPRTPFEGVPTYVQLAVAGQPIPSQDERIIDLHDKMIEWTDRWYLRSEWCLERGFRTLERWCSVSGSVDRFSWASTNYALLFTPLSFRISEWDGIEPLSKYRANGKKELTSKFNDYCKRLAAEAHSLGAPVEHARHSGSPYRWTVLSQVLGKTTSEIAHKEGVAQSTVDEAVKALLRHLDIPARPKKIGRPVGARDKSPRRKPARRKPQSKNQRKTL